MCAAQNLPRFREVFFRKDLDKKIFRWFPGHMNKGMIQMQRKLAIVDCIVEVHDARIPFSGRNPDFYRKLTAIKPHIFVLNKMDLIDMSLKEKIEQKLKRESITNVIFTNCRENNKHNNINQVLPMAIDLMQNVETFHKAFQSDYKIMIIGIPNVGKSSLINRMRNLHMHRKNSNLVGGIPGITKTVSEKVKIHDNPVVYLFDTPGVMEPQVKDVEVAMRLASCCTLKDHLVGEEVIADYMLYWLNKHGNFSYVEQMGISTPTDSIKMLLVELCRKLNLTKLVLHPERGMLTMPDFEAASRHFIKAFRNASLGKFVLDDDLLNS